MKPRHDSRPEPEIILPGDPDIRSRRPAQRFGEGYPFVGVRTSHRIYTARLGPFGLIRLALALVIAAVMLVLLLGAVLFWIPILVLLVAAAVISGLLRR